MENYSGQLRHIISRVQEIIEKYNALNTSHQQAIEEINHLKGVIASQQQQIEQLENEIKLLSIAHGAANDRESTRELKLLINEYIREIDRCIKMLND